MDHPFCAPADAPAMLARGPGPGVGGLHRRAAAAIGPALYMGSKIVSAGRSGHSSATAERLLRRVQTQAAFGSAMPSTTLSRCQILETICQPASPLTKPRWSTNTLQWARMRIFTVALIGDR